MRFGYRFSSPLEIWAGVRTFSSASAALRRLLKLVSARPLALDLDASSRPSCPAKACATGGTPTVPTAIEAAAAPATRPRNERRLELFKFLISDADSGPRMRMEGFMNDLLFRMYST